MLNKIYNLVPQAKGKIAIITLLKILLGLLGVMFAFLMKATLDAVSVSHDAVLLWGGLLLLDVVLEVIINLVVLNLESHLRANIRTSLQIKMFSNLLTSQALVEHSGSYMAKITSDVSYLTDGISSLTPGYALMVTKVLASFVALGLLDYVLILFIAVLGLLFIFSHFLYKKYLSKAHERYQTLEAKSQAFMQEVIENQMVVHSFGKDSFIILNEKKNLVELYEAEIKRNNVRIFASSILNVGMLLAYGLIIIYGALRLTPGSFLYTKGFTFGSLTAIMSLYTQLETPMSMVVNLNQKKITLIESYKRVRKYLEESKESEKVSIDFKKLSLSDFSFSYPDKEIFSHTSFVLNKGDMVTIKGESGIGKSTLIKLLLGSIHADKPLLINDETYLGNELFAYVPQGNWLLSGTIKDNLTLFDDSISLDEINRVLDLVVLPEFKTMLNDNILERAKDISEGQAQRISIARALLLKREILLLDEVTSALDKETERKLLENLQKLGQTIIYISHKDATNRYSNRLYEIKNKQLVEVKS